VKPAEAPLAAVQPVSIEALLGAALAEGRSAEEVKQIHELMKDVQAHRALAAFNWAFVEFKRNCPPIPRTRRTKQYQRITADGRSVDGSYADLEGIEKVVGPALLDCGLSYRWIDTKVSEGQMVVVCRLAHVDGHYEDSPSPAFPVGQATKGQSAPQASASVSTYACRYSLKNSLGLTTVDEDDDGRGENAEPAETITEEQQHTIQDLIIQAEADRLLFLKFFEVKQLGEIPSGRFEEACRMLNQKIEAKRKGPT
jgi:hypothetical protein